MKYELDKSLIKSSLNPAYRMSNYVQTDYHSLACTCAEEIIKAHGTTCMNPLLLIGQKSVGKTHILQAIANEIIENEPQTSVQYMTADDFNNLLQDAKEKNQLPSFISFFHNIDVLIIDDLQTLKSPEAQDMLVKVTNYLFENHKQIVFASKNDDLGHDFPDRLIKGKEHSLGLWLDDWHVWDMRDIIDALAKNFPDNFKDFLARILIDDIGTLKETISSVLSTSSPNYEDIAKDVTIRFLRSRG